MEQVRFFVVAHEASCLECGAALLAPNGDTIVGKLVWDARPTYNPATWPTHRWRLTGPMDGVSVPMLRLHAATCAKCHCYQRDAQLVGLNPIWADPICWVSLYRDLLHRPHCYTDAPALIKAIATYWERVDYVPNMNIPWPPI